MSSFLQTDVSVRNGREKIQHHLGGDSRKVGGGVGQSVLTIQVTSTIFHLIITMKLSFYTKNKKVNWKFVLVG